MNKIFYPIEKWRKDHWSLLLYIDYEMLNMAGFQIGYDARMRTNRKHYRTLKEKMPKPSRTKLTSDGSVMDKSHTTRIHDSNTENHDDWNCVEDMLMEDIFTITKEDFNNSGCDIEQHISQKLIFSEKGEKIVNALRHHKFHGGKLKDFLYYNY